jgi:gamma-glutamyltranspeptidase/glutathione hydrolase
MLCNSLLLGRIERMRAGVAAGHPATAEIGAEILADGGTAADAVVAMALASCVGETVLSGLLAGCHAIVFDGSSVMNLDGFAAVPTGEGELVELPIAFGEEIVAYSIGPASCAVPGLPGALGELWRAHGRLPWARLVEPALRLANEGVPLPEMHGVSLAMLSPLYTLERGAELYAPEGRTLATDEVLRQPGLVDALEAIAEEGADSVYRGSIAEAILRMDGVVISRDDLREYRARWREPVLVPWKGYRVATRGGLSGIPELLPRLPRFAGMPETERVLALVEVLETPERGGEHTTNMVAVDGYGRACVLTHSLGVGAGVWVPGLDLQLNNLLGESDIAFGEPKVGDRLESRMAPSLVLDDEGPALAIGSAGATRLRTALSTVLVGLLDEGLAPEEAVSRPRVHPTRDVVDAEPGVDESALAELESRGRTVRRWDRLHHYFGGVSCVGRTGAAGDPRRSGAAILLGPT